MHNKYEVKYELAYLVYQCFSCNNVVCKSHMAWAKRHVSSCYKSRMLCKYWQVKGCSGVRWKFSWGVSFSGIWLSSVFGVHFLWRHNLTSYYVF